MTTLRPDQIIRDKSRKKVAVLRYRTLENYRATLTTAIKHEKDDTRRGDACRGTASFCGTPSAEVYRDMLLNGWQAGVVGAEGLEGLSTDAADRLHFVRDVAGAFPLVPAFLRGAPNAMLRPTPTPVESVRGLTLVIDGSYGAQVNSETVLHYAHTIMRLVAWLSAEQIETSVYVVLPVWAKGNRYIYTTPIRLAGDVIQPERVAAILHPSFLRRAWFSMVEHEHHDKSLPGASICLTTYGQAREASAEEMQSCLPEAYSVIMLPKIGRANPEKAIQEAVTLKLKQGA